MIDTDVLIVGAGPTGLALAAALAKHGISFRIIDTNLQRSNTSKALGVQAGTLEAIEDVFGTAVADRFFDAGAAAHKAVLHLENKRPVEIQFDHLPSRFNCVLILEQSETERIFEELLSELQAQVERGVTLVNATVQGSNVNCELRNESGASEFVRAQYVVGCDGAHSFVRKSAGIAFQGNPYTGDFLLGDLNVDWRFEHGNIRAFATDRGAIACFPMRGLQKYRIVMVLQQQPPNSNSELKLQEFQDIANEVAPDTLEFSKPVWLTRFRVHHRMAEHFRKGPFFLAGDAAHIHSPAGGQGMNTGIQDSLNLASKLALVIQQKCTPDLLDQYEQQRLPVAKNILRATDFVFRGALLSHGIFSHWLRHQIIPNVIRIPQLQMRVVHAMSELQVARKEIELRKSERLRSLKV